MSGEHRRALAARRRLWSTFRDQAEQLKRELGAALDCFIGVRDRGSSPNVFFRVGHQIGSHTNVIALTVSPGLERDRLVFNLHTVRIVNGKVSGVPSQRLPVSYDPSGDYFIVETAPPKAESDMARFFLRYAERLLDADGTQARSE